jgi:hypothetical protein
MRTGWIFSSARLSSNPAALVLFAAGKIAAVDVDHSCKASVAAIQDVPAQFESLPPNGRQVLFLHGHSLGICFLSAVVVFDFARVVMIFPLDIVGDGNETSHTAWKFFEGVGDGCARAFGRAGVAVELETKKDEGDEW